MPVPLEVTQPLHHFAIGTQPLPTVPPQLGSYRVLGLLARGGMGGVYLGEHLDTGERVALKVLDARWGAHETIVGRMLGEHDVSRRVRHAGLVRILEGGRVPHGAAYLAMELLDGEDLGVLADRGRIELGAAVAICAQVADATVALHDAKIVHCDLKPENVMVEYRHGLAGWPRIKVLDYGVARIAGVHTGPEVAGTPCYMAPEQWRGHAEARSDVYGLGCMLYELIVGQVPFDGTLPEVMTAHCEDRPPAIGPRRWVPELLERLVLRMLSKDPGMRPRMTDVATTLTDLAFQHPPGARTEPAAAASRIALAAG